MASDIPGLEVLTTKNPIDRQDDLDVVPPDSVTLRWNTPVAAVGLPTCITVWVASASSYTSRLSHRIRHPCLKEDSLHDKATV